MFLWLDCDPGHDDAMAILVSLFGRPDAQPGGTAPEVTLLGISTTHGNQSLDKVTRNALEVLAAMGASGEGIPVVRGAEKPLVRDAWPCPEIHGDSGLDGSEVKLPLPRHGAVLPAPGHVAAEIFARIRSRENLAEKVHLVATGALTNVANLLSAYPAELAEHVSNITLMGGAIGLGNITPAAYSKTTKKKTSSLPCVSILNLTRYCPLIGSSTF